jgi:hypothetical protein
MVALAPSRFAVPLVLAAVVAAGCAAGPSLPRGLAIEAGRRTRVEWTQVSTGQTFALQNASSGTQREVYSDHRTDELTKVVDDADLQALLDVLTEKGLFAQAAPEPAAAARDLLVVRQGDRRWIWSRLRGMPGGDAAFQEAKAYFLSVYNAAVAFHTPDARPDLKAEDDRVRTSGSAARERLERQQLERKGHQQ